MACFRLTSGLIKTSPRYTAPQEALSVFLGWRQEGYPSEADQNAPGHPNAARPREQEHCTTREPAIIQSIDGGCFRNHRTQARAIQTSGHQNTVTSRALTV